MLSRPPLSSNKAPPHLCPSHTPAPYTVLGSHCQAFLQNRVNPAEFLQPPSSPWACGLNSSAHCAFAPQQVLCLLGKADHIRQQGGTCSDQTKDPGTFGHCRSGAPRAVCSCWLLWANMMPLVTRTWARAARRVWLWPVCRRGRSSQCLVGIGCASMLNTTTTFPLFLPVDTTQVAPASAAVFSVCPTMLVSTLVTAAASSSPLLVAISTTQPLLSWVPGTAYNGENARLSSGASGHHFGDGTVPVHLVTLVCQVQSFPVHSSSSCFT